MDLGLIKRISSQKKIKLDDLAKMANIKRATFFNYLSGKTSIPADSLKTLSDILDIPIAHLYNESNNLELMMSNEPEIAYASGMNTFEIPLVHKFINSDFLSMHGDDDYLKSLPKFPVLLEQPLKGNYLCFEVGDDSMFDGTHKSRMAGDIVLSREYKNQIEDLDLKTNRYNFLILHKEEGLLIRRIVSYNANERNLTLRCLNGQYEDSIVSQNEILRIFVEIKLVSRNTGI
ncbi:MAG: helix-turn-helix transcriptional regulator [Reichenbachiella sp.]|uniref:helix-turn-helix transcriptional regulator n=1 Tax=Reichenbachiella sp. TaxID=2184521 RepID=UPI003264E552